MSSEPGKGSKARFLAEQIRSGVPAGEKLVFVAGNFNIVHPGHLRLLKFAAECGDYLAVGVSADTVAGAILPQQMRLDGVQAIGRVNAAFLLPVPAADFIAHLKPDIVVKGKEHERHYNPEQEVMAGYGGKLLFAAGESRFSSLDLLQRELVGHNPSAIVKPEDYLHRHEIAPARLADIVGRFKTLRAIVVGDLIVDEYITCEPLGMSQEEPTIVVTPLKHDLFVGGAGIVAAHARGLGARVDYFGVCGDDASAAFAETQLASFGVASRLLRDESRPTTLKQRFRAHGKTLLRVSHLRQHDISQELIDGMLSGIEGSIAGADVVLFADFNYGCLPQALVDAVRELCARHRVPMVADSQSSSQVGDISRFRDMLLVTPT